MELNGVLIEDTFAEAFPMRATRVIITADEPHWARTAATAMTGFATSVIACGCEAGIELDARTGCHPGRQARRRRPAVRDVRPGSLAPARHAGGPVRAHLRLHRLLRRARGRGQGVARQGAALLRRRLADQQEAGCQALLAPAGDGRRVRGRARHRRRARRGRRQLPDPLHLAQRGAGGGRGRHRRHAQGAGRDHALPRRDRALGLQGGLEVQGPRRLDQRRLLPDPQAPEPAAPSCRTRSRPCSRSSSTG